MVNNTTPFHLSLETIMMKMLNDLLVFQTLHKLLIRIDENKCLMADVVDSVRLRVVDILRFVSCEGHIEEKYNISNYE